VERWEGNGGKLCAMKGIRSDITAGAACRRAGTSLCLFAVVVLATSLVTSFLLETCTIDLIMIVLFCLGQSIRHGSSRAAKWGLGLTVYYIVVCGMFSLMAFFGTPEQINLSGRKLAAGESGWAIIVLAPILVWSFRNLFWLREALREIRYETRLRNGQCVQCESDLTANESGRCPECGTTFNQPDR